MNFSLISRVEIMSYIFGYGLFSIVLAAAGFGAWSLILGYIIQQALATLLITLPYGKLLSFRVYRGEMKELLGFSSGISLANIANYVAQQGDYYMVGRILGVESLGLYNRAYNLMQVSVAAVINTLDRVLFPALAKMQGDAASLAKALRLSTALVWMAYLPLSMVLTVCASDVVAVLLGRKWIGMTGAFRILTYGLLFRAGYKMAGTVLKVKGEVLSFAITQIVYAVMVVLGAAVGARHGGIEGTATGVLIALGVNYFLLNYLGFRSVQQRFAHLYRDLLAALILTVASWVVSAAVLHFTTQLGFGPVFRLACVGLVVTGAYVLVFWALSQTLVSGETGSFLRSTWQSLAGHQSKIRRRLRKMRPAKPHLAEA
jgi:PST family polysaccharide transporter